MVMRKVRVTYIDTISQPDPYRRDTGGRSTTSICIDPRDRTVRLYQSYPGDNSTLSDVWHGLVIDREIGYHDYWRNPDNQYPDASAAREYLESDGGQELLKRICDGHEINWDGHNMVGSVSDDVWEALETLMSRLNMLPQEPPFWTAEEIFGDLYDDEIPLSVDTTEADIREIVSDTRVWADGEGYTFDDNEAIDYLVSRRDDIRDRMIRVIDNANGRIYEIDPDEYRKYGDLPEDLDGTPNDSENVVWLNVDYLKTIGEDTPSDWPEHLPVWEIRYTR